MRHRPRQQPRDLLPPARIIRGSPRPLKANGKTILEIYAKINHSHIAEGVDLDKIAMQPVPWHCFAGADLANQLVTEPADLRKGKAANAEAEQQHLWDSGSPTAAATSQSKPLIKGLELAGLEKKSRVLQPDETAKVCGLSSEVHQACSKPSLITGMRRRQHQLIGQDLDRAAGPIQRPQRHPAASPPKMQLPQKRHRLAKTCRPVAPGPCEAGLLHHCFRAGIGVWENHHRRRQRHKRFPSPRASLHR